MQVIGVGVICDEESFVRTWHDNNKPEKAEFLICKSIKNILILKFIFKYYFKIIFYRCYICLSFHVYENKIAKRNQTTFLFPWRQHNAILQNSKVQSIEINNNIFKPVASSWKNLRSWCICNLTAKITLDLFSNKTHLVKNWQVKQFSCDVNTTNCFHLSPLISSLYCGL